MKQKPMYKRGNYKVNHKSNRIDLRLTNDHMELIKKEAESLDETITAVLRIIINSYFNK